MDMRSAINRLATRHALEPGAEAALADAALAPTRLAKGDVLGREGAPVGALAIVVRGMMIATRRLPSGCQQHVAVRLPSEFLDQPGFVLDSGSVVVSALTPSLVAAVPRSALASVACAFPSVERALRRELALTSRVAQEWMVSMGRRPAYDRIAHFLCELETRMRELEMTGPGGCPLPLTQSDLADLVGLSVVHTNRVLQQLRREGLLAISSGRFKVLDPERLLAVAGFDPAYLRLQPAG